MSRLAMRRRTAFSLLEVIIATAILAGSAMVLFSLISMGAKYGNKAEERTLAITQAESFLDEFIARMPTEEIRDEVTGVLPGTPPRSFRIEVTPYEWSSKGDANQNANATSETGGLYRVTLELFEASTALAGAEGEPLCQLSQLVRRGKSDQAASSGIRNDGANSVDGRSLQGQRGNQLR
jgi:type II secretory pathway pseudopilin PulG